jgi:hypothetical protein
MAKKETVKIETPKEAPKMQAPDVKGLAAPNKLSDKKYQALIELVNKNENVQTKTRVPSVLAMTFIDMIPLFGSAETLAELWLPTPESSTNSFGDRYRINAISLDGQSRQEFVDLGKNYMPEVPGLYDREKAQLNEGNKKGGKK